MNTNETPGLSVRPIVSFSETPWGLRDLLFGILFAGIGIVVLNIAALWLDRFFGVSIQNNNTALMIFVIIQDLIIVGGAWLFSVVRYHVGWERLGLRQFDVAFGCLLSAALFALSYAIRICYVIVAMLLGLQLQPQQVIERLDTSVTGFPLTFLAAAILAPVAEEIFFRGFLYGGLRRRIGVIGAMIASTVFFTALHFSIDVFIPLFFLGLFLAWLYEKTGSLYPGIILHASNNALALIALLILQLMDIKL